MDRALEIEIRENILLQIIPTPQEIELQKETINSLVEVLETEALEKGISYQFIEPQGSTGKKQTQLRNAGDIDLFIALSPEEYGVVNDGKTLLENQEISTLLDGHIENWIKPAIDKLNPTLVRKTYSQHPYLTLVLNEIDVDIVLCFSISPEDLLRNGPITAVDRTIHHTRWVVERISERQRNDVRILKSFVRASHVYGDACAIGRMGFTGYTLEMLIINEREIMPALHRLSSLYNNPIDPLERDISLLRTIDAFKDDHLFIIDPTDPNRNAASSFDPRCYSWLKIRTSLLIESINRKKWDDVINMVIERPVPKTPLKGLTAKHSKAYEFLSDGSYHYTVIRDKLYSLGNKIVSSLEKENTGETRFGKALFELYFERNRFALGLMVETPDIEKTFKRRGPPIGIGEGEKRFREAHQNVFEKEGHLWSVQDREWTNAWHFTNHVISADKISGLELTTHSDVSARVLNTLSLYILQIEPEFSFKGRSDKVSSHQKT